MERAPKRQKVSTVAYWFRNALRLHDNKGLCETAAATSAHFCFFILSEEPRGPNRRAFELQALQDLDTRLRRASSRLFVLKGPEPLEILGRILAQVDTLYFEESYEPVGRSLDDAVRKAARPGQICSYHGHTLFPPASLAPAPRTYTGFRKKIGHKDVPHALDPPTAFLSPVHSELPVALKDVSAVPEFGVPKIDFTHQQKFQGGESKALERMEAFLADEQFVAKFSKPETAPTSYNPPSTTVLSPYLANGCLSVRIFYHRLVEIESRHRNHTNPPTSLLGQVLWREFYYAVGWDNENFHRMQNNPICLQVDWNCANPGDTSEHLEAWASGRTGYPFIDAIMRQLRSEGWIHHLARHAVACFLTRGDLYISWERGLEVFEELLLDADYFLNAGNWMWLSTSAFFNQYWRVYSPIAFGKKTDKLGAYIKQYVPELKNVPTRYIYEPWKMSAGEQAKAKCIIGKDYPTPIIDHDDARKIGMSRMKAAFEARREGGS
ncbi:MAG: hypothetical protein SGCHY_005562 [Lobulomycetales sp.]